MFFSSLFTVDINNFSKGAKWLFIERWFLFLDRYVHIKKRELLLSGLSVG